MLFTAASNSEDFGPALTDSLPGSKLATFQSGALLSIILNKDANGFPSWWRTSLPPNLHDTPTPVYLPHHNTPLSLSHFSHEWERPPGVSLWVLRTVRSGYTVQFGRNPPCFVRVHLTVVSSASKASVLQQELSSLLLKGSNRGSTSVGPETRLFQQLLPFAKEGRWSMTHSGPVSSEPLPLHREVQDVDIEDYYVPDSSGRLVCHCRPEGCLFSNSGRLAVQEVPSVCFRRKCLPLKILLPGLGPEDVHKVHACCSSPFRAPPLGLQGIRVLHYLDDWLILAHSRELVSYHIRALGLRTNTKKSVLTPSRQTVFLGVHLYSVQMQASLAPARIFSFNACMARFKLGHHVSVSTCHRLLGLLAAASPVLPLRLLHMRPFLWWMRLLRIRSTGPATRLIREPHSCFHTLLIWRDPTLWNQNRCDSPLPHFYDGRINDRLGRSLQSQTGARFLSVFLALIHFLPLLRRNVKVRTDNMVVVSHINRQGGSRSRILNRLACRLFLWSQDKFLSLRAVRIPGVLNLAGHFLPGEWMLNRQTIAQIWDLFGVVEVELFASQESSQCSLWFSLNSPAPLGIDAFAHPWPNVRLYVFPQVKLIPAALCRVKESGVRLLLVAPFWPSQMWFSALIPLLYRPPWEIPIRQDLLSQLQGKIWHPRPEIWKLWVWPIQGH